MQFTFPSLNLTVWLLSSYQCFYGFTDLILKTYCEKLYIQHSCSCYVTLRKTDNVLTLKIVLK